MFTREERVIILDFKNMKKREIIPGQKIGRLTIIKEIEKRGKSRVVLCICDCGKHTKPFVSNIFNKNRKCNSCGCLAKELARDRVLKHGETGKGVYLIWNKIRRRCNCKEDKAYHKYGGRGIKLDDRWNDFLEFKNNMGPRPSKKHSIDRIDNNGNYSPENCRWATSKQQGRNKGNNTHYEHNGLKMTCAEWNERWGIPKSSIQHMIRRGRTFEYIFNYFESKKNGHLVKNPNSKPVEQFLKNGIYIKTFCSISEAVKYTGIQYSSISKCCNGFLKSAGGFIWKFKGY